MIYKQKKKKETASKLILILKFMVEFLIASYPYSSWKSEVSMEL